MAIILEDILRVLNPAEYAPKTDDPGRPHRSDQPRYVRQILNELCKPPEEGTKDPIGSQLRGDIMMTLRRGKGGADQERTEKALLSKVARAWSDKEEMSRQAKKNREALRVRSGP